MGIKDLQAFIAAKKKKSEEVKEINWLKKRDDWLAKLNPGSIILRRMWYL